MITSTSNTQVRQLQALQKKAKERSRSDVFVVEGIKMFREVPRERLVRTYVSERFYQEHRAEFADLPELVVLAEHVFESVSDTKTPQGVLCLVRQFHYGLRELLGEAGKAGMRLQGQQGEAAEVGRPLQGPQSRGGRTAPLPGPEGEAAEMGRPLPGPQGRAGGPAGFCPAPLVIILENLQDPGNLGTILRTAEGAGVTGILLSAGCVDLYNPKVVRSTMGSIYRMPFCYSRDWQGDLNRLKRQGVRIYAAHLGGSECYDQFAYDLPTAFLIGNESRGLTEETATLADARIRIPMCGQVESLNAAVSASILMYEASRQRRAHQNL